MFELIASGIMCATVYGGNVPAHEYYNFTAGVGRITDVTGDGLVSVFDIPNGEPIGRLQDETTVDTNQWAYDSNCHLWIGTPSGWVHGSGIILSGVEWY